MNVVVPMAGLGSRFQSAGYSLPKPLIPAFGEPMYAWALKSLPLDQADSLLFICLKEHLRSYPLREDILARYAHLPVRIVELEAPTGGQAETVMRARNWIDNQQPLLIFNADTYVTEAWVEPERAADGVIQTFDSDQPSYSYVRLNEEGWVCEVAEKVVISRHASTGLYYFARGEDFVQSFLRLLPELQGESYVMLAYRKMLEAGKRLLNVEVGRPWVLGTPQELEVFLKNYR